MAFEWGAFTYYHATIEVLKCHYCMSVGWNPSNHPCLLFFKGVSRGLVSMVKTIEKSIQSHHPCYCTNTFFTCKQVCIQLHQKKLFRFVFV